MLLSFWQAIPIAMGSVLGSGVLFLPGAVAEVSSDGALLSCFLGIAICAILVPSMTFLVARADHSKGVRGLLEIGLGSRSASGVNYLVLGTVIFGMPASAIVAGEFMTRLGDFTEIQKYLFSTLILLLPAVTNLLGMNLNSRIQAWVTFSLVAIAMLICFTSSLDGNQSTVKIKEFLLLEKFNLSSVLRGTVLTFWAFAGFENLVFMSAEFRCPKKDIPRAMLVAIVVAGIIYLAITYTYIATVPLAEVNSKIGLYQLAEYSPLRSSYVPIVVSFAFLSIFLNFSSWFLGLSRLMVDSSREEMLPFFLAKLTDRGVAANALLSLVSIQLVVMTVMFSSELFFQWSVSQVSFNFFFLYGLLLISVLGVLRSESRSNWFGFRLVFILIFLLAFAWIASRNASNFVYPILLFSASAYFFGGRLKQYSKVI
jgi:amino acid efflux transporter